MFTHDSPQGEWRSDSHLAQVSYKAPFGTLSGYVFLLDFENAAASSSATWGARLKGERAIEGAPSIIYLVEYARQLGFEKRDIQTVRKYMPRRRHPRNPSSNWLSFIRNHMDVSWAMDFCVVRTIGFRALYVFVVLERGRRRIRHWAVTECPSLT